MANLLENPTIAPSTSSVHSISDDSFHHISLKSHSPAHQPLPSCSTTFIKLNPNQNVQSQSVYSSARKEEEHDNDNEEEISGFASDQDFINHIIRSSDSRLEPFLTIDADSTHSQSSSPVLIRNRLVSIWRFVDPRKPNRHRKFLERTRTKLRSTTFKQVHQILLFNSMLNTLTNYNLTLARFQANSSKLHRCLIKWDRLKSRDQSFSRTSLEISLNLQRFMDHIHTYYPASFLALTPGNEDGETEDGEDGEEEQAVEEPIDEADGQDHSEADEGQLAHPTSQDSTTASSATSPATKKLGLRAHLFIRFRLHQLRSNARKFNRQFRQHESEKMELKLAGNQCIFDMVKDGKFLLEINDELVSVILDLVLLRGSGPSPM